MVKHWPVPSDNLTPTLPGCVCCKVKDIGPFSVSIGGSQGRIQALSKGGAPHCPVSALNGGHQFYIKKCKFWLKWGARAPRPPYPGSVPGQHGLMVRHWPVNQMDTGSNPLENIYILHPARIVPQLFSRT